MTTTTATKTSTDKLSRAEACELSFLVAADLDRQHMELVAAGRWIEAVPAMRAAHSQALYVYRAALAGEFSRQDLEIARELYSGELYSL